MRVLLVDDHRVLCDSLRALLERAGYEVMSVHSIENALTGLPNLDIGAVILDLRLPDGSGLNALLQMKLVKPLVPVVILTAFDAEALRKAAQRAGASALVSKTAPASELVQALEAAIRGDRWFEAPPTWGETADRVTGATLLTPRQRQVLHLIAEGVTAKGIARVLGISIDTVSFHERRLRAAFQVPNNAALVRLAAEHGLLGPPPRGT